MKSVARFILLAVPLALSRSAAEPLDFGPDLSRSGWVVLSFPRIPPASFVPIGPGTLEVTTDASAGMLWQSVGTPLRKARIARWHWTVTEGVPPTDLTRRGSDDRALGVYFVFGTAPDAAKTLPALLRSPTVTALVYVYGGDKPRGSVLPSPHMGERGKFLVLRPADAQKGVWFGETVNLAEDYGRAFGTQLPLLLAIAVSSDSDDTGRRNRVRIRSLAIER